MGACSFSHTHPQAFLSRVFSAISEPWLLHPVSHFSEARGVCLAHPSPVTSLLWSCDQSHSWWGCWHPSFSSPQLCHPSERFSDNPSWLPLLDTVISQATHLCHPTLWVQTLRTLAFPSHSCALTIMVWGVVLNYTVFYNIVLGSWLFLQLNEKFLEGNNNTSYFRCVHSITKHILLCVAQCFRNALELVNKWAHRPKLAQCLFAKNSQAKRWLW